MDPYVIPGTRILRNRKGFLTEEEASRFETQAALLRQMQLWRSPLAGPFDRSHVCAVHRYLFQDVFDWAGELRTVDIQRDQSPFARHDFLAPALDAFAEGLRRERHLAGLDADALAVRLAFHFGELNAIHPFREGNGRMQREFFRTLALVQGFALQWELATQAEMYEASDRGFRGDHAPMAALMRRVIRPATDAERAAPVRRLPEWTSGSRTK